MKNVVADRNGIFSRRYPMQSTVITVQKNCSPRHLYARTEETIASSTGLDIMKKRRFYRHVNDPRFARKSCAQAVPPLGAASGDFGLSGGTGWGRGVVDGAKHAAQKEDYSQFRG
jgi:hypothetical protein